MNRISEAINAPGRARVARDGARPVFRSLVRAGFVARAVTYGVIGALALAIALGAGTGGAAPDQAGALALIARAPLGRAALVLICAGLLAYAVWKLTEGIRGGSGEGEGQPKPWDRVSNVAGGVAYLVFFAVAVQVLTGSAGDSSATPRQAAAGVLGWPAGDVIVGAAGAILIATSLYQLRDAVSGAFAGEIEMRSMGRAKRRLLMASGRVGLAARAIVFALVGYFLLRTAIDYEPSRAVGVDGALAHLHREPLGQWLLGLVAAGLLAFAVYSVLEGAYRRL
ncbi:MAG TPA: DUF1206 domain-containing protein [Solirubrobacteraceae bacterium]